MESLSRFHSANKVDSYSGGVGGGGRKGKKYRRNYRTSPNTRIMNGFLESLLLASFPSLGATVYLTSLRCLPTLHWSLDLLGGSSL